MSRYNKNERLDPVDELWRRSKSHDMGFVDESKKRATTPWINPTLTADWSTYDGSYFQPFQYRIVNGDVLEFRGILHNETVLNTTVCTIPEPFRLRTTGAQNYIVQTDLGPVRANFWPPSGDLFIEGFDSIMPCWKASWAPLPRLTSAQQVQVIPNNTNTNIIFTDISNYNGATAYLDVDAFSNTVYVRFQDGLWLLGFDLGFNYLGTSLTVKGRVDVWLKDDENFVRQSGHFDTSMGDAGPCDTTELKDRTEGGVGLSASSIEYFADGNGLVACTVRHNLGANFGISCAQEDYVFFNNVWGIKLNGYPY